jgi:hypothetical protein
MEDDDDALTDALLAIAQQRHLAAFRGCEELLQRAARPGSVTLQSVVALAHSLAGLALSELDDTSTRGRSQEPP